MKARNVNAVVERHARVRMREIHKRAAMSESERFSPQPESQVLLDETSCVSAENVEKEQLDTLSAEVQTDVTGTDVQILQDELSSAYQEIASLKAALVVPFSETFMQGNAADVRFYTGLPNSEVVKLVFEFIQPYTKCDGLKLSSFQQFMMVMLKLRMNSPLLDLAHRFGVSQPTVSRVLLRWLTAMDIRPSPLIRWPDRESLRAAMPLCFQERFGKRVAVVIDCFEVFMERPTNLLARACTWSNYKHHNTVKVLLGMTPQGVISFVSDTWGGRVSDKYITENCGFIDKLLPGDVVLADRGFNIAETVGMVQAELYQPAYTKGKEQLSALEVEETREIANVRIHVERVIGAVKQKFAILQSTLPIDFVSKRAGEPCPLIDRVVRVSCALCNLCDSLVPFN